MNAYDLKSFYKGLTGRIVAKVLRQKIVEIWPEIKSKSLMGYGYALPYLGYYKEKTSNSFVMMPSQLGVHNWPANDKNIVCLNAENLLPLETNSVDMILMVHALEFLDSPEATFEELWRVLKSSGRLLIVVPNRMGLWVRADWSPFGQGTPFSARQVEAFLRDNLFVHEGTQHALFTPPFRHPILLRLAGFFEKVGAYLYPALGGVHIIEASKQIYAGTGIAARNSARERLKKIVSAKPLPTPRA